MKVVTLFDEETGEFGAVLTLPESAFDRLAGSFKRGRFDRLSQRVDLATGEVVVRMLTDAEQARHAPTLARRRIAAERAANRKT